MTLMRMVLVLVGALVLMLTVVILRAETARLYYRTSQMDSRIDALRQQLHDEELELQRLRNPGLIRQRARELRLPGLNLEPTPGRSGLPPAAIKRSGKAR